MTWQDLTNANEEVFAFLQILFISYNQKPNFCINTESIFIEIFLPKSKSVLIYI